MPALDIRVDDVRDPRVIALLDEHLRDMHSVSPPGSCHALDLDGLRDPSVIFWSAWDGDQLAGCGALKTLDATHAEIKSMRTSRTHLRRGIARLMLEHILAEARKRGFARLSLETGTQLYFEPARRLYEAFGFQECPPFGDYVVDPNSAFMTKELVKNTTDKVFAGAIPKIYESHLVPLIFEPYAQDAAARLRARSLARVLEIAAGTGVVTRAMAAQLPKGVEIVATDLNQAMLDEAASRGTARPVQWKQADAMALPFDDRSFDAIVCQFGAMFFPDRVKAFGEARRVLKPGGVFLFSVWDRIEDNEFSAEVTHAVAALFPTDPPRFLPRTPHGYTDQALIRRDLIAAGFTKPAIIDVVTARSRAASAQIPATAYCQGTPLRSEIEARGDLTEATRVATEAIAKRFGTGEVDGKIQALVVTVEV